jgi:hypothetical protein
MNQNMEKQNMVHSYNGKLLSNEKERGTICATTRVNLKCAHERSQTQKTT